MARRLGASMEPSSLYIFELQKKKRNPYDGMCSKQRTIAGGHLQTTCKSAKLGLFWNIQSKSF
ncbi:hypothetical protein MTR_0030s0170 [Medicago truncatula]|uniref:Uncharacterized protein n=1 Tax=Medicago truncatula TaxID=3880 RepID=G7ZUG8_MEDTR|nr:hypothetical protein MTR_0030s0170 [Medicago truncatula]